MRRSAVSLLLGCAIALAFLGVPCPGHGRPLAIAANTAGGSYDPVSGIIYLEMRKRLQIDFPGTTFTSLPVLTADLRGFDLLILNRFGAEDLQPAEQTNIRNYVLQGGNLLYVGEAIGPNNDTFTLPFGISMVPDPSTDLEMAFASFTNPSHPYLTGSFGVPADPPSGSYAAEVTTLGPSVELARWEGGGIAVSAIECGILAPGAGFGLFLTDVNMMTPTRYSHEFGPLLSNALSIEPVVTPNLSIVRVTGGATLTWGTEAVGWTLQTSDTLVSWSDLGAAITASGSYTDTSGQAKRFFRLKK